MEDKVLIHGGTNTYELTIQHVGVKGMKWGVRKSISSLSSRVKKFNDWNHKRKYGDNDKNNNGKSIRKQFRKQSKIDALDNISLRQKFNRLNSEDRLKSLGREHREAKKLSKNKNLRKMTDSELEGHVSRLQARVDFQRAIKNGSWESRNGAIRNTIREVAKQHAINSIHGEKTDWKSVIKDASYNTVKNKIKNSNSSDYEKTIAEQTLNAKHGRDRHGNKKKK